MAAERDVWEKMCDVSPVGTAMVELQVNLLECIEQHSERRRGVKQYDGIMISAAEGDDVELPQLLNDVSRRTRYTRPPFLAEASRMDETTALAQTRLPCVTGILNAQLLSEEFCNRLTASSPVSSLILVVSGQRQGNEREAWETMLELMVLHEFHVPGIMERDAEERVLLFSQGCDLARRRRKRLRDVSLARTAIDFLNRQTWRNAKQLVTVGDIACNMVLQRRGNEVKACDIENALERTTGRQRRRGDGTRPALARPSPVVFENITVTTDIRP